MGQTKSNSHGIPRQHLEDPLGQRYKHTEDGVVILNDSKSCCCLTKERFPSITIVTALFGSIFCASRYHNLHIQQNCTIRYYCPTIGMKKK